MAKILHIVSEKALTRSQAQKLLESFNDTVRKPKHAAIMKPDEVEDLRVFCEENMPGDSITFHKQNIDLLERLVPHIPSWSAKFRNPRVIVTSDLIKAIEYDCTWNDKGRFSACAASVGRLVHKNGEIMWQCTIDALDESATAMPDAVIDASDLDNPVWYDSADDEMGTWRADYLEFLHKMPPKSVVESAIYA